MPRKKGSKRKFAPVAKTKRGVQKVSQRIKEPRRAEAEIKRTQKLYKQGKLTPAMMDRILKQRAKDGRKKRKAKPKSKAKKIWVGIPLSQELVVLLNQL